jgi:hypothetical protein
VSGNDSIRAASIFYNKGYYISLAEHGSTINNIILVFDQNAKWRIYRGLSAATLSYFFNEPYFCSGTEGRVLKFLSGATDNGSNIELDIRTKAFDFDNADKRKALAKMFIIGKNTGASFTPSYSTDGGTTFKSLVNSAGSSSFTTTTDGQVFVERLVPQSTDDYQGQQFVLKLVNNDSNPVEIHELGADVFIRQGDIL